MVGLARLELNHTKVLVTFSPKAGGEEVEVVGEISGLGLGMYALLLVSLPGGCQEVAGAVVRSEVERWDQGPGETVQISTILSSSSLPHQAGLLIRNCTILQTGADCRQGDVLQCAEISWSAPTVSWHLLVVISVAVFLLVLVLICIPLICYCVRRYTQVLSLRNIQVSKMRISSSLSIRRSRRKRADENLDDEYEDRSKSPMYDELSLPFIDASLPPTPKVGRIVNGLDILLGHGVSENSLVGEC